MELYEKGSYTFVFCFSFSVVLYLVGFPCNLKTPYEGLQSYVDRTLYASGCSNVSCESDSGFDEAICIAKEADFVVVVAGLDLTQETEDLDRRSLLLPGQQMALISSVAAVSKRPMILVLTGGGPLDVSFAKLDRRVSSILWIGYPGEGGGKALAEVIFGEFNPGLSSYRLLNNFCIQTYVPMMFNI